MKRYVVPHAVLAQDLVPLIAHDLRTPVTAIKGYSQLVLRQAALPPQIGGYLASVVDEANQIASLIDDLVLVSQIERGAVVCQLGVVDLERVVRRLLDGHVPTVQATTLTFSPSKETVLAYCDPDLIRRAVSRLLQFALKYCRSNESGYLGVRNDGDQCFVWIATRPAVTNGSTTSSPTNLPDTSTAPDDDLGRRDLRMYICARLAELQNGSVLGTTGSGEGSVFYLTLPSGSKLATPTKGG